MTWERAASGSAFSRFAEWTRRYQGALPSEKAALEEEGIRLARERLDALVDLIQANPKEALELAVPLAVRQTLPKSVENLLEERVSARGDSMVVGSLPLPGKEGDIKPLAHMASIGDRSYDAYSYGWRAEKILSSFNVPIMGIAAPRKSGNPVLAVSSQFARLAEPEEATLAKAKMVEPICGISGLPASSGPEETALDVGGEIQFTCRAAHAALLNEQLIAAAAGGTGPPVIGGQPLAGVNSYTMGRKRFLLMRPVFANYTTTMPTNTAVNNFASFSNFMYQMSYGQLTFAGLGQGSDVTPEMLLPGVVADYDNTGLGKLFTTSKSVAATNYGYDLSQYDFIYVVTAGAPAANYSGLGFVGGVGFHLANSSWGTGTASHEFGHNLGLNHANFWNTDGRSAAGFGQSIEYGDGTDPMGGGGSSPQHYGARYKNYLGWIPSSDIATASGSTLYRLYAHDGVEARGGLRGVKYPRTGSQNYWIQFRQNYTTKALSNGVQLLWTGNNNEHSQLLDVRLKSAASMPYSDNALVIGQTFSDVGLNLHITPIAKGHTYPESIDVAVNVGPFPGNFPPQVTVSANTSNAGTGQAITFVASATDPNGDSLAYYWDYDDGDFSVENSSIATHSFSNAGEYNVQCAVSDMKGGVTRRSVLVRVGNPSTYRISGRVVDANGHPIGGVRVFANSTSDAFTDNDGRYAIARLSGGGYRLDIIDPLLDSLDGLHPFFNNPVAVGPNFTTADFSVGARGTLFLSSITKKSGNWKYLDDGSNQGTGWLTNGFSDSAWKTGTGIFGFGDNINTDASTTLSYGPNSGAKYVTYYFRKPVIINNPANVSQLLLETLRQGGVIVYLNGTEIFRENMPLGAVISSTLAINSIPAHTYRRAMLPPNLLVAGTNVVAAELHLVSASDDTARFDLGLSIESVSVATGENHVYISAPTDGQIFTAPANVPISAVANSGAGATTRVEFYADGIKLGEAASAPFVMNWNSPSQDVHSMSVVATVGSLQLTSAPVVVQILPPASMSLLATGSVWNYYATNAAPPGDWTMLDYDDSAWLSGPARLGFSSSNTGIATIIDGGPSGSRYLSVYFRSGFVMDQLSSVTNLNVSFARDDGLVVYLNGNELFRNNIQNNVAITYGTLAASASDNGNTYFSTNLPAFALVPGTNIIAVEVHQSSSSSSDLLFDFGLSALTTTNRPRNCSLVSPLEGARAPLPGNVILAAEAVAGDNLGVAKVEFFADGQKLGEDTLAPFNWVWTNASAGNHQLSAIATDSAGNTITSAPVSIMVATPQLETELISPGDIWRYLDDGTNPGAAWQGRTFNESAWKLGAARLGYGGDGEVTTVGYGPDPNNRRITTYFRHGFTALDPGAFSGLKVRLIRDDGAVVYLNGVEIFRSNMATGQISYNSLALSTVSAPDETTFFETIVAPTTLLAGNNTLAVEVHQVATNSSDLGFDLELIGLADTNFTGGIYLTNPNNGQRFTPPAAVPLNVFFSLNGSVEKVEYFDGQVKIGESTLAPFNFNWGNPPTGPHLVTARATYNGGTTIDSPGITITVDEPVLPVESVATLLFPRGSTWAYLDDGSDPGDEWANRSFDDRAWKIGTARFGHGLDGEVTKLATNITTHYFRKWFLATNSAVLTELLFRLQRDDGAVIYVNGLEAYRANMPSTPINPGTPASSTVDSLDETYFFETRIPTIGSGLMTGSNLVAVELHQDTGSSPDAGFDLELWGLGSTEPQVYLSAPEDGSTCPLPGNVRLDALAWAGRGRSIVKVEFFDGVNKVGEATSVPYSVVVPNAALGPHRFTAKATDDGGRVITSAAVRLAVITAPPVYTTLIPAGSIWKYFDKGSNLLTAWSQRSYNDSSWSNGPAMLGYGDANGVAPRTTLGYGGNSSSKYITYYFRRWFTLPDTNTTVITNLSFRLQRDDGAVGYLNGVEVFRSNMPGSGITYATLASANVDSTNETTFFPGTIPIANLVAGTNILAVEVHQSSASSSDLSFDFELTGVGYSLPPPPPPSLTIQYFGSSVRLTWPSSASGYNLYSTPALSDNPGWTRLGVTSTDANGVRSVTLPIGESEFYRLQKP